MTDTQITVNKINSENHVIEINNICKAYGKGENKLVVLDNVSLNVKYGEFLAILGPSGSGKTTLMNLIGLIDTMDSGSYMLDGIDINRQSENVYAKIRNQKISFVFQRFNLIPKYNAMYNVALPLLLAGHSYGTAKKKALETLNTVGLSDRWRHRPNELSGGQQQRVAIARALVSNCPIILADEPTGALDQKTGFEILDFMTELKNNEGKTIILITHDINIAKRADRIINVRDGKITAAG
ncbi:MAG: ABC transporter ATP-binding protein [Oscillospiraceae bacterium]|nr:ABC transporter ATP-binding protein [Oscillospiraceae bacterium]